MAAGLAGPAAAQSIGDALAAAYGYNATLEAARAELRAVDENVPQAIGNWLPTVQGTADGGFQRSEASAAAGGSSTRYSQPYGFGVTLNQPVFNGGSNFATLSRAENLVLAQRASLADTEQTVLLAAATAFVDVARDQSILRLRQNNVEVLERQLQATQDRFSVGEDTRTDVAQTEAELATARANLTAAQGDLRSSIAAYVEIIGAEPGDVEPPAPPARLPETFDDALALARANNPEIARAQFAAAAAESAVDSEFGGLLPRVALEGSYSRRYDVSSAVSDSEDATIRGTVTIPFYSGGQTYSSVRQAKQTAAQRRVERVAAERSVVQEATSAWQDLLTAEAQITSFQAAIDANAIALDGVRQEAQVGSRTVLNVLEAERDFLEAQVNLVAALRDRIVAAHALLKATGQLTAQSLDLAVERYDPQRNYDDVRFKLFGTGIEE